MSYQRTNENKNRLRKLLQHTSHKCVGCAYYDADKGRIVRIMASNTPGYTKYLRRRSNKRVRGLDDIANGTSYKKVFDYKWELF